MFLLAGIRGLVAKYLYRQNGGCDEGPTDPPKLVGLETNHHLNVFTEPLQTCRVAKEM